MNVIQLRIFEGVLLNDQRNAKAAVWWKEFCTESVGPIPFEIALPLRRFLLLLRTSKIL